MSQKQNSKNDQQKDERKKSASTSSKKAKSSVRIDAKKQKGNSSDQSTLELFKQKEKEWQEKISISQARLKQVEVENQQLRNEILTLHSEQEKHIKSEIELQEKIQTEIEYSSQCKKEKSLILQQIDDLQIEKKDLVHRSKNIEVEKRKCVKKLRDKNKENKALMDKYKTFEEKLRIGNMTIEKLLTQKQDFDERLKDQKYLIALEWAQGLGTILSKLTSLAGKEPEPILGLTPRAVYETLLDWMEKVFGERPKTFPSSKEFTRTYDNKPLITLDADAEGIQGLLNRYDWSHELPFEGKPEGQRQCQFKIMQWGWRVRDTVLVRTKITYWNAEEEQLKSENHE